MAESGESKMHVIDAHCDTLLAICEKKEDMQYSYDKVKTLKMPYLQFFAMFCPPSILSYEDGYDKSVNLLSQMMNLYDKMTEEYSYIKVLGIKDIIDFEKTKEDSYPSVFSLLSIEGVYLSKGDLSYLDYLYSKGVRCLSFTWNPSNEFAQGVNGNTGNGLTVLGKNALRKCHNLGILIDVSHASDKTFYDIAALSEKPFVATHSNSRHVCSHKRNLDDDMLKTIAKSGGLAGINYFSDFLVEKEKNRVADISDIIKHIEYMSALTGTKHIGFGSDFDGIDKSAIKNVTKVSDIINALLKLNYSEDEVRDICSGNMIRILKEVMQDG